jgi:hypothetical protein
MIKKKIIYNKKISGGSELILDLMLEQKYDFKYDYKYGIINPSIGPIEFYIEKEPKGNLVSWYAIGSGFNSEKDFSNILVQGNFDNNNNDIIIIDACFTNDFSKEMNKLKNYLLFGKLNSNLDQCQESDYEFINGIIKNKINKIFRPTLNLEEYRSIKYYIINNFEKNSKENFNDFWIDIKNNLNEIDLEKIKKFNWDKKLRSWEENNKLEIFNGTYLRKELLPNLSDEIKMINELINYENTINTKTNLFNSNNYIVNSIKNEIIKQLSLINNKHIKINDQIIEIKNCIQPILCAEDNNEYDNECKIYPENYKYCYETHYYFEKAKIILKLFDLITSQNYISKNNNIQILPENQNESKSLIIKKLNNIINFENENNKTVELIIKNLNYILDGLNGIKIKINYNDKIIIFSRLYDDNYQEDFELNFEDEKNIIVQLSKLLNPSFDIL